MRLHILGFDIYLNLVPQMAPQGHKVGTGGLARLKTWVGYSEENVIESLSAMSLGGPTIRCDIFNVSFRVQP